MRSRIAIDISLPRAGCLAVVAAALALGAVPVRAQYGSDGPKPSDLRMPAPTPPAPAPRRPAAPAAPPQAAAPAATAEDPAAAAAGDAMLPPALRNIRDAQPADPELVAGQAGLRLRRSQPVDLRGTGRPPSAAEFGDLLAPR
ncbi:hypothetical protein JYK14_15625 [Siccirubricoccus sp. KC 17139]|uniref:DUF3035 domain-containing protein n=1 Tax=Siccirubricoccus soli TaxID=2899147 RepID=A0ABT1D6M1_9PROT|nr:hypothetical protein [Siccirubricoccus soli]MCO6417579.1 hypothetical protein [Siccirubricoccus soli]MCP2683714.1 hypothetical protein [Siccirubricoccus soli]